MSERRVSRAAVSVAGVAAGLLVFTAVPSGQQQAQGRGRWPGQVPQTLSPQIKTPTVPDASRVAPAQQAPQQPQQQMNPARVRAWIEAARRGLNYLPGEVLVKFKDGVGAEGQTRALQVLGTQQTADTLEWIGAVAVVRDESTPDAYALVDRLRGQPDIEYAEPNFIARTDPGERVDVPTPPPSAPATPRINRGSLSSVITGIPTDSDYASFQWNFQLIGMPNAWDIQPGGSADIIVAVIDTGITASTGNMVYPVWTGSSFQNAVMPYSPNVDLPVSRHVGAKDYVGSKVPGAPFVDLEGHGTHVSATIGETTNNATLVSGIAYNVRIMPVKVCASYWDVQIAHGLTNTAGFPTSNEIGCLYADMAAGIQYAVDNGARVMNMSIGGIASSTTLQNALVYAASKGAFISLSMGNSFESGNPTMYPASYAASIDGVMSVASVGFNSAKAYYSSAGNYCEIAAPGGDSRSGSGRLDRGLIWQSTLLGTDLTPLFPRFDRYDKQAYQGTSMAAPHVAGVAALLMSQNQRLTGAQVERILRMTVKDLGAVGKDDSFGYGLIQPRAALFGYGIR